MAQIITIHHENPQMRLVRQVVNAIKQDKVIAYPTESGYALGCQLSSKKAYDKICQIRRIDKHHNFTLMLNALSEVGQYAQVDNHHFRLLKTLLPGPYTIIFPSTRLTPNRLMQPKRRTIGIRLSQHKITQAMLMMLDEPIMSVSLILAEKIFYDAKDVASTIQHQVDVIIDGGFCPPEPTTVIDLSGNVPEITRQGSGDIKLLLN